LLDQVGQRFRIAHISCIGIAQEGGRLLALGVDYPKFFFRLDVNRPARQCSAEANREFPREVARRQGFGSSESDQPDDAERYSHESNQ
jgi:hypothetical protein